MNFDATVTQVTQLLVPDYDDDFLATYTDYTTKEDYEASIRSALEDEYTQTKLLRCDRRAVPGCRGRYYLQRLSAGALRFLQGGCSLRLYGLRRR
ncbi:MAG: hypothetical protein ACLTSZ_03010 [Lachnospiraceae bacterium]